MVLTAAQLTKIATSYAEAAQKICDSQDQGSELAWKANWFHILALIVADRGGYVGVQPITSTSPPMLVTLPDA